MKRILKILLAAIAAFAIIDLALWQFDFSSGEPEWGITFSEVYASRDLKLDWRAAYEAILDEMPANKLRLVAYWNLLEPKKGEIDFRDLDWQISEATKRGKEIILAVGYRVPRWPECHIPDWADPAKRQEFQKLVTEYLTTIISRYKNYPAIKVWQVENEPLLTVFGECPEPDRDFLKKEIVLVRSLDPARKILVTDSGELSLWIGTAGLSEIFGTTLYRIVWNPLTGWWKHIYPPALYTARSSLVKKLTQTHDVIIAELQAELWVAGSRPIAEVPLDEQIKHFSLDDLKNNLEIAKKTGIKEIYLWGVEWWYWRKLHGDPSYWNLGEKL